MVVSALLFEHIKTDDAGNRTRLLLLANSIAS